MHYLVIKTLISAKQLNLIIEIKDSDKVCMEFLIKCFVVVFNGPNKGVKVYFHGTFEKDIYYTQETQNRIVRKFRKIGCLNKTRRFKIVSWKSIRLTFI